jgi:hypothetical protein
MKNFDVGYEQVLDSMKFDNFRRIFSFSQVFFFWADTGTCFCMSVSAVRIKIKITGTAYGMALFTYLA